MKSLLVCFQVAVVAALGTHGKKKTISVPFFSCSHCKFSSDMMDMYKSSAHGRDFLTNQKTITTNALSTREKCGL